MSVAPERSPSRLFFVLEMYAFRPCEKTQLAYSARLMLSLRILFCSVVRFRPSRSAAPPSARDLARRRLQRVDDHVAFRLFEGGGWRKHPRVRDMQLCNRHLQLLARRENDGALDKVC